VKDFLKGIKDAAKLVASTMGPYGSKVLIKRIFRDGKLIRANDTFSRDGITVARACQELEGSDEYKAGVRVLIDACDKTNKAAGDGTTTTAVFVDALLNNLPGKFHPASLALEIREGAKKVVDQLKSIAKMPTREELDRIAITSANNQEEIGKEIAEVVWNVGGDGYITHTIDPTVETVKGEVRPGYQLDAGMLIQQFHNAPATPNVHSQGGITTLIQPLVLLIESKISDYKDGLNLIVKAFREASFKDGKYTRPLVIIASDIQNKALQMLIRNLHEPLQGQPPVPIFVVKSPSVGDERLDIMEDLRVATGTKSIFGRVTGKDIKMFSGVMEFGQCEAIEISGISTKGSSRLLLREEYKKDIDKRVEYIKESINDQNRASLEERITKLTVGIGIIHIGGYTETQHGYLKQVVEDCVRASQSAMKHGFIRGGGQELASLVIPLPTVLECAMVAPKQTILNNAGLSLDWAHPPEDDMCYEIIPGNPPEVKWVPKEESDIIDSVHSTSQALLNATSLVGEIIQTKNIL
jgi:chaperonin GroEL